MVSGLNRIKNFTERTMVLRPNAETVEIFSSSDVSYTAVLPAKARASGSGS
jgi:hypothetical protein